MIGPSFDRTKLDNLTLGLDRNGGPEPVQAAAGDRAAVGVAAHHRATWAIRTTRC